MLHIAGDINSSPVGKTFVHQCQSSCTWLLFPIVGQFSCFRALVTHSSSFIYILLMKCAALSWTCSSHDF